MKNISGTTLVIIKLDLEKAKYLPVFKHRLFHVTNKKEALCFLGQTVNRWLIDVPHGLFTNFPQSY
jgi:hypothetical protein